MSQTSFEGRTEALTLLAWACAGVLVAAQLAPGQNPTGPARPSGTSASAPARPANPSAKPPTAVIRGTLIAAAGGGPLLGAQVHLVAAAGAAPGPQTAAISEDRTVATDTTGRFEIRDLPAGQFRVTASKTGYAWLEYGQRAWGQPGSLVDVTDGQTVDRIDFALPRAGVIAARVTDSLGEPLGRAGVEALEWRFVNGRRTLLPSGSAMTNDLGEARVHGLAPGEYYIRVHPYFGMVGAASAKLSYVPTYYPGTLRTEEAQRVRVAVAQDTNVTMALSISRLSTISGTALKMDGSPVAYTPLGAAAAQQAVWGVILREFFPGGGFSQRDVPTRSDGTFSVPNLLPGTYVIQIRPVGNLRAFQGPAEFAHVPVTVSGDDVTDLAVVSKPGARVSGRLIFDTGAPPAGRTAEDFRVAPYYNTVDPPLSTGLVTMHPDFSFEIPGLVLTGMVRLAQTTTGWSVKSVMVDGKDIVEAPMTFEAGREYKDVEITLTQKRAEVRGAVADADGRPVKSYVVVLFPQDKERWFPRNLSILAARPDQNGQFRISRIPGGTAHGSYYVVALDALAPGAEQDFELLAKLAPMATRITLGETDVRDVSLKVQEVP